MYEDIKKEIISNLEKIFKTKCIRVIDELELYNFYIKENNHCEQIEEIEMEVDIRRLLKVMTKEEVIKYKTKEYLTLTQNEISMEASYEIFPWLKRIR